MRSKLLNGGIACVMCMIIVVNFHQIGTQVALGCSTAACTEVLNYQSLDSSGTAVATRHFDYSQALENIVATTSLGGTALLHGTSKNNFVQCASGTAACSAPGPGTVEASSVVSDPLATSTSCPRSFCANSSGYGVSGTSGYSWNDRRDSLGNYEQ